MVDESTDIFISGHLVVFAIFLEDGVSICIFSCLLYIPRGKKDVFMIYELILIFLNKWGLDLDKFVGFGSGGSYVITGTRNGVAAYLKGNVNLSFKLFIVLQIELSVFI